MLVTNIGWFWFTWGNSDARYLESSAHFPHLPTISSLPPSRSRAGNLGLQISLISDQDIVNSPAMLNHLISWIPGYLEFPTITNPPLSRTPRSFLKSQSRVSLQTFSGYVETTTFSNSLIIHKKKTKEFTTVTVVWIPEFNQHTRIMNALRSHIKNSKECFIRCPNTVTSKSVKKYRCASFFRPTSRCLDIMMKHSFSWLIYYISTPRTSRIRCYLNPLPPSQIPPPPI